VSRDQSSPTAQLLMNTTVVEKY